MIKLKDFKVLVDTGKELFGLYTVRAVRLGKEHDRTGLEGILDERDDGRHKAQSNNPMNQLNDDRWFIYKFEPIRLIKGPWKTINAPGFSGVA